jgi:RNA polymerase sigma-70 factor (ECF subfamily)
VKSLNDTQLSALYHQYGYFVRRRCLALLQDPVEADDALQDVFLRIQRYGAPPRGEPNLAWLYGIAFNVCCDHLRHRRRQDPLPPELIERLTMESVGSPEEADRRAAVSMSLRQVGRRTREMVLLHYLSGLTQEEVAQASGYSRRTVGKKLRDFAQRLHRRWTPQGDGT